MGKSVHRSRKRSSNGIFDRVMSQPGEGIHIDVVGPMKGTILVRARFFVTTVDEHSSFSVVRFINRKPKTAIVVIEMIRELENLYNLELKPLTCLDLDIIKWGRSDGGGACVGNQFQNFLKHRAIVHEVTIAILPESIRRGEGVGGALEQVNMTTIWTLMLAIQSIKFDLWAEVVNTASYIRNRR